MNRQRFRKLITTVLATACIASLTCSSAMAATYNTASYSGALVKKTSDYISGKVKKVNTGSAYNWVSSMDSGATLVSWVVNTDNNRKTTKCTYTSTGKKTMDYNGNASTLQNENLKLRISTAANYFQPSTTTGSWTPN